MTDGFLIDSGGSVPYQTTEHYFRRVLAGDVGSVRSRIIIALERLGYDVIDDDELTVRGRRSACGWGTFYSSADVLDYPRSLVIKLKPVADHSTRVTFDYVVKHPSLSAGEKDILTREAEAISSVATIRNREKHCTGCGAESTDDSRFCRRCGAPVETNNRELELLNMAAEVRSGLTSVTAGEIASSISAVLTGAAIITIISKGIFIGSGITTLLVTSLVISLLGSIVLGFGLNRMMRSLKRPKSGQGSIAGFNPSNPDTENLFPETSKAYISVTENTTSLLDDQTKRQTLGDLNERVLTFEEKQ